MNAPRQSRAEVEAAIPHRDPFLFVDRIVEETEDSVTTEWDVPAGADWFRGHYPGRPILPGVLISEHVFQSAAILVSRRAGGLDTVSAVPVLSRIESARFRRLVRPGETLRTRVTLEERVGPAWFLTGDVRCAGASVLRIRCALAAAPVPDEEG
ncbi:MAG: 3-hydroxyacyl-ACP dehydratase FabZ family protein [Planctomycetota bacterium]